MADLDDHEQVNREITAIAAQMAGLRELIEQMQADGRSTAATELALQALSKLYRQRLRVRQGFVASAEVANSEPAPSIREGD